MKQQVIDLTDVFLRWQFLATCLAIMAAVTTLKAMGVRFSPLGRLMDKSWFKAFVLTPLNPVLGALASFIPNWLTDSNQHIAGRLILGVVCGLLSLFAYTVFKKRLEVVAGVTLPDDPMELLELHKKVIEKVKAKTGEYPAVLAKAEPDSSKTEAVKPSVETFDPTEPTEPAKSAESVEPAKL